MMDSYKQHLAEKILNDSLAVTYRQLSRDLKVHVNTAKQMLYDFYQTQNKKQPKSVQATYLISGTKSLETQSQKNGHDDDVEMGDETVPVKTISIVREDDFEAIKSTYISVASIHVYSLQPGHLQNLEQLSPINAELYARTVQSTEPLELQNSCGSVINPEVRRRKGAKPVDFKTTKEVKPEVVPGSSATVGSSKSKAQAAPAKNALFSSFAKTKPKEIKPEPKKEVATIKKETSDVQMQDEFSDDDDYEEDESFLQATTSTDTKKTAPKPTTEAPKVDKDRADREAKLRAMMDADDDDDDDDDNEDEEMKDEPAEPNNDTATTSQQTETKDEEVEEAPTRRRGRRRVMKKKTYTDDEGYLVTKEEPDWESFSEEEVEVKKPKPSQNTKKAPPPKGQGNIMSFFGKK